MEARRIAVSGYLMILRHFKVLGSLPISQASCSQSFSSQVRLPYIPTPLPTSQASCSQSFSSQVRLPYIPTPLPTSQASCSQSFSSQVRLPYLPTKKVNQDPYDMMKNHNQCFVIFLNVTDSVFIDISMRRIEMIKIENEVSIYWI